MASENVLLFCSRIVSSILEKEGAHEIQYRSANGWTMSLLRLKIPVARAYEAMTSVAKAADEAGFEQSGWLITFLTVPTLPLRNLTFECWMSLALARDTSVRVGQIVTA